MKTKDKKNKKSIFEGYSFDAILVGLLILITALIGLIGKGPIGQFLQYSIVFLFGNFYLLFYAFIIFFALYLMITKRFFKIKLNLYFLSWILIISCFLIGASTTNVELTISNFTNTYLTTLNATPGIELFKISSFEAISYTGGGYLGYMLRGFFNTCFTPIGTSIAIGIFAFFGISIYLKDIVVYFIKFFNEVNKKMKENRIEQERQKIEVDLEEKEETIEQKEELALQMFQEKVVAKEVNTPTSINESAMVSPIMDVRPTKVEESKVEEEIEREEVPSFKAPEIKEEQEEEEIETFSSNPIVNEPRVEEPKPSFSTSAFVDPLLGSHEETNKPTPSFVNSDVPTYKSDEIDRPIPEMRLNKEQPKAQTFVAAHEEEVKFKNYVLPPLSLLQDQVNGDTSFENRYVAEQRLAKINECFAQFKTGADCESYTIGPSCTRFNIRMHPGVKVSNLTSIQNEIAIKLDGNKTVRLELVVEGRDTSSLEIGNAKIESVSFKDCLMQLNSLPNAGKDKLLVPLGKGIEGNVVTVSLDELPHLLVAGTTGSGKSVFVNTIIATLLMRNRPDELKLMLIDPKKVEFSKYNDIPHLLCPVITEAIEGKNALRKLVDEMERRYSLFLTNGKGVTKLSEYNELAESLGYDKLPNIVMICDEFSDFMSEQGKEIEPLIKRLAQKARACGIYLIICTQRPSVNVITGDIKAVIPSRIALLVPQGNDSRTILDEVGAESLLGNGDMLARIPRHNSLVRVQGSYIQNLEIIKICEFIRNEGAVDYNEDFMNLTASEDVGMIGEYNGYRKREKDPLHEVVKRHVIETRIASTNNLESRFSIGYGRADHILNCLEDEGVIKRTPNGNRRIVVMTMEEYLANQAKQEEQNDEGDL